MKKVKYLIIPATLIMFLLLTTATGLAQGQVIAATVDRTSLTMGDTLTLNVTVTTDALNAPTPTLPSMPGFTMVGSGSSSQISIINGAMSSQVIHTIYLQPYETGPLVIDPITVNVNGQTYNTEPITVEVTPGNGNPTTSPAPVASAPANPTAPTSSGFAGQKVFAEAEVSKATPFMGEQIIYTFRLYQAKDIFDAFSQPQYEPPTFTGFWVENTEQSQYQVQAAGTLYDVIEARTTLFPSVMGPATIDPARLVIPDGFFSRGGTVQTDPVTVDVKPLPEGAPANFSGAVGQFTLDSTVDTHQTRVNEPVTWKITLNGWGNLNSMADPVWPEMVNWRSFESQATTNTQFQDGRLVGRKDYQRLLVPETEGEFVIPALEYTYFNPTTGTYETISTQTVAVTVAPGDGVVTAVPPVGSAALPNVDKETVAQFATDIRHLKPVPAELSIGDNSVTGSWWYWLAWVAPMVGLVGNFLWQRKQYFRQNNAGAVRSLQAHKKAKKSLAQIRRHKPTDVYNTAGQVFTDYLSDKLDYPVAGLTHQALADRLNQAGLDDKLIERVTVCWTDTELGRFSPEANDPAHAQNLLQEIEVLIKNLERNL
jgi:hypothetical protein